MPSQRKRKRTHNYVKLHIKRSVIHFSGGGTNISFHFDHAFCSSCWNLDTAKEARSFPCLLQQCLPSPAIPSPSQTQSTQIPLLLQAPGNSATFTHMQFLLQLPKGIEWSPCVAATLTLTVPSSSGSLDREDLFHKEIPGIRSGLMLWMCTYAWRGLAG